MEDRRANLGGDKFLKPANVLCEDVVCCGKESRPEGGVSKKFVFPPRQSVGQELVHGELVPKEEFGVGGALGVFPKPEVHRGVFGDALEEFRLEPW